jgi:hypothetical protein
MDLQSAQKYIQDSNAGLVKWDDNARARANSVLDASNPQKAIEKAVAMQKEAIQPAVSSLQASIPETQAKYSQARQQLQSQEMPLQDRYKNLIDSIKGQKAESINKQTIITNSELAKRGLSGDSTMAQQEIQNVIEPISRNYMGMEKEAGLAREDSLRMLRDAITNLTPQEVADTRSIQNAIAQLQSGAGQAGIGQGLNLYQSNLDNTFRQQQFDEAKRQNDLAEKLAGAKSNYLTLSEGQTIIDPNTGQIVYTAPKTYKPESPSGGMDLTALMQILGGNTTSMGKTETPSTFQPIQTSTSQQVGQRLFKTTG